jgi:putative glutamine amidotransferase
MDAYPMAPAPASRAPRWYTIPVRVGVVTFIGTLLCFAVSLLFAILGTVILAALRGVHPDMRMAYRHIALPMALVAGSIIFALALVMEIRHYRQSKILAAIERMGPNAPGVAPRIAIPMPHSSNPKYAERALPQYERAVALAGGKPVRIPLDQSPAEVKKMIEGCDGVLLPGSNADVDPARFNAARSPRTADADPRRDAVDDLLLEDAYRMGKPVLGICYGLQSLNVYRRGSLIQHIPDFLPEETRARVNHAVGKKAVVAHTVEIEADSRLARIVSGDGGGSRGAEALGERDPDRAALKALRHPKAPDRAEAAGGANGAGAAPALVVPVNSSHHQSADSVGDGLRIVARCPDDGIIEALEGNAPDHFVLAVQWHPERAVDDNAAARAIFRALVDAAGKRREKT